MGGFDLSQNGPLYGYKVLDLSQGAAGPVCTAILGAYGADVIKIEPPWGDWGRRLGPPFYRTFDSEHPPDAAAFAGMNCNKRSLAVDLKQPRGRQLVRQMCGRADVLVEAFRPGVMERLDMGYTALASENPGLVYCAISAFGPDGAWQRRPGVDGIVQGVSGLMSITGTADGPPVKVSVAAGDVTTGLLAVQAIVLALLQGRSGGQGQQVSLSLLQSLLFFQQIPLSMFLAGTPIPRSGSAAPYAAPNEAFATLDGHLMVAAYQVDTWERFCRALGLEELISDARFADNASRVLHRRQLHDLLSARLRGRTTAAWLQTLGEADIPCGPILTYDELVSDPEFGVPDWLIEVEHPAYGRLHLPGLPFRMHGGTDPTYRPPPLIGQHSRAVLQEFGLSPPEIAALEQDGIIRQYTQPEETSEDESSMQ